MTLRLGGDGAITGCTSLENPDLTVSGLTISGSFDAEKVLVASGTAAAPSYTFSGDTDNGLYYAGTNSIGVSTAGTSAIVVDASQNVGIGTTSVTTNFKSEIRGETYQLRISNAANNKSIRFGTNDPEISATGASFGIRTTDANPLLLFTNNQERMRIDSSGKVLIGTTSTLGSSVSDLLHLQTTTGGAIDLGRNDSSISAGNLLGRVRFYSNAGSNQEAARLSVAADGTHADDDKPGRLEFYTTANNEASPTERMRINSSGRLLVGLTDDLGNGTLLVKEQIAACRISNSTTNNQNIGTINFVDTRPGLYGRIRCQSDGTPGTSSYPGKLMFYTTEDGASSPTERLRIDSNGVLIASHATINGGVIGTNGNELRLQSDINANGTPFTSFYVGASERMRIDSSGRLQIGLTDGTGTKLHVANGTAQQAGTQKDCARFIASTNVPANTGGLTIGAVWHNTDVNGRIAYLQSEDGRDAGGNPRRLALNPDGGNVGIGTTSMDELLHIETNTATVRLKVESTAADSYPGVRLTNPARTYDLQIPSTSGALRIFDATASSERMRLDNAGDLLFGTTSVSSNNKAKLFVNNNSSGQHTLSLVNGTLPSLAAFFESKGKHFTRNTSERNIDLVQSRNAGTNINVVVFFEFFLNTATADECGRITGQAGFYRSSGGNFTFWVSTPAVTMFKGTGYGAGTLSWVGADSNVKILRYTTDSNFSYTKYTITELKVTGHDYAPVDIL